MAEPPGRKEKLNGETVPGKDAPEGTTIKGSSVSEISSSNIGEKEVKKNVSESQGGKEESVRDVAHTKGRNNKEEKVKGLLPQKEGGGPKKGLRA